MLAGVAATPSLIMAQSEEVDAATAYTQNTRDVRIAALRSLYKINLNDKERALVGRRCVGAQGLLRSIQSGLQSKKFDRANTYTDIVDSLSAVRLQFDSKQIDVSAIDLLIVNYQDKIAGFDGSITSYEISLDDAIRVDCARRPDDFRSALEGVRAARKSIVEKSSDIQQITKSDLKTTLDAISLKLVSGAN